MCVGKGGVILDDFAASPVSHQDSYGVSSVITILLYAYKYITELYKRTDLIFKNSTRFIFDNKKYHHASKVPIPKLCTGQTMLKGSTGSIALEV